MTAFQAEGCGIALSGDEHEVSVTDSTFCVIWHNKHYDDQPPPVAFPPLVPYGTKGGMHFLARRAVVWFFCCRKAAFILAPIRAPTTTL